MGDTLGAPATQHKAYTVVATVVLPLYAASGLRRGSRKRGGGGDCSQHTAKYNGYQSFDHK